VLAPDRAEHMLAYAAQVAASVCAQTGTEPTAFARA